MDLSGVARLCLTALAAAAVVIAIGLIAPAHHRICTVVVSTVTISGAQTSASTTCATSGAQP
jgi:hypothetical protein